MERHIEMIINGTVYRKIPGYKDRYISAEGVITKVINNVVTDLKNNRGTRGVRRVPVVNVVNESNNDPMIVSIAKLTALAWVPNDNPAINTIVIPLDGNVDNTAAVNLKWCSRSHGMVFNNNKGVLGKYLVITIANDVVIDRKTVDSMSEIKNNLKVCTSYLKVDMLPLLTPVKGSGGDTHYLVLVNDKYYDNDAIIKLFKRIRYSLHVIEINTGNPVSKHSSILDITAKYGLNPNIRRVAALNLRLKSRGYRVINTKHSPKGLFDVKNLNTGDECTNLTVGEVCTLIGCTLSKMYRSIKVPSLLGVPINNWLWKVSDVIEYPEVRQPSISRYVYTCVKDDEVLTFYAIREMEELLMLSASGILSRIKKNVPIRGYTVTMATVL